MENKLHLITPQYSSFVDDQVLTSHQLNEFIEYFKEQDHLSRICLTGIGIVCGFELSVFDEEGTTIQVTQGCGITSDGDLLKLQQKPGVGVEVTDKSTQDSKNIIIPLETYKHYKEFEDADAKYEHFRSGENTIDLWELIPIGEAKEDDEEIEDLDLSDKVAILYLENFEEDPSNCTGNDCDNQGQPNVQNVKILLATKEDVENVVINEDEIFTKYDLFEELAALPETAVDKLVLRTGLGSDNNISDYSTLAAAYKDTITEAKQGLHDAYTDLFSAFGEILDINGGTQNTVLNQIDALDDFTEDDKVQYRYDLTHDISDSFNEILRLLIKVKTECCPNVNSFPKHLLLGCLEPEQTDYPELRHQWYPSPTNTQYETYVKLAKNLMQRVVIMLDNFNLNTEGDLQITPSKLCSDLGEKAIPEYYTLDDSLLKTWDYFKTENLKSNYNLSYHKDLLAPSSWVQNPLKVSLDCHDFFRIEGLQGSNAYESYDKIREIIREFGLDFECLLFDIKDDAIDLKSFIKENPSIEHRAGTPRGGTFILISEQENVVADFCLSYKASINETGGGCCTLRECSYPWISSLKYLNNLARSLKGTQSVNKPMPQNYILNVVEYTINGTRLINTTVPIVIPMWNIFNRRMHAITEALNNRFHDGVVFDYNENEKKFLITYAKDDTFKIRFQEATVSSENPTYTYSPNGMFRNNKIFRQKMMTCRELRAYSASFYKDLQKQLAPVDKDDDYGVYDEKWRKWQDYRDRMVNHEFFSDTPRFPTRINDLPQSVRPTLDAILRDLRAIDNEIEIYLDGEWVNGTWLSSEMIDHYNQNPNDTHDPIILFMKLRVSLHNKQLKKETHLSIYITNRDYSTAYDSLIEEYCHEADFYFAPANGSRALRL